MNARGAILYGVMALLLVGVGMFQSWNVSLAILNLCLISAIMALGVNIQWGYAGLFNAGIMAFVAIGGFMTVFLSFPRNEAFWGTNLPWELSHVLLVALAGTALVFAASRLTRLGASNGFRTFVTLVVLALSYLAVMRGLDPVAARIEAGPGWIGGFGLPVGVA